MRPFGACRRCCCLLVVFLLAAQVATLVPQISPKTTLTTTRRTASENEIAAATLTSSTLTTTTATPPRIQVKPVRWPKATYFNATSRYVKTTTTTLIDDNFDVIDPSPPAVFINSHSNSNSNSNNNNRNRAGQQQQQQHSNSKPLVEEAHRKKIRHHHTNVGSSNSADGNGHHKWPAGKVAASKKTSAPAAKQHHSMWSKNDILSPSSTPTLTPLVCYPPSTSCPAYRLIEKRTEYEIRWYPSQKWASSIVMTEEDRLFAIWEGLHRLQEYFGGHNEPAVGMNMTWPLLQQFKHGRHPGVLHRELRDVTLSTPLPARFQLSPPTPLTAEVLVDTVEASTVFVHSFRARIWDLTDRALRQRADRLMATLRHHGEAFHGRYFYLASFTKPDNADSHVYEMWIHATRLRDPGKVKPTIKSRDPPLSKLTARTRRRLCRGVECPPFDVLRAYKFGIQKRRYFDTVLAQANANECEFNSLAVWRGSMPLHLYKHGINSHWEVLEATRPIGMVHISERAAPFVTSGHRSGANSSSSSLCRHNMTVSLYLPRRLHSNPPTSGIGAPPVKINRISDLIVYVQTVGGSILDPVRSTIEVKKFSTRLKQLGLCYKAGEYYLVTYDFMARFHGRQNEIWFVADRCPVPSADKSDG